MTEIYSLTFLRVRSLNVRLSTIDCFWRLWRENVAHVSLLLSDGGWQSWHSLFTYVSLQSLPPFSPGLPLRVSSLLLSLIGVPVIGFRACPKPRIISSWNFQLYLPKTYSQIRMHAQVIGFGYNLFGELSSTHYTLQKSETAFSWEHWHNHSKNLYSKILPQDAAFKTKRERLGGANASQLLRKLTNPWLTATQPYS